MYICLCNSIPNLLCFNSVAEKQAKVLKEIFAKYGPKHLNLSMDNNTNAKGFTLVSQRRVKGKMRVEGLIQRIHCSLPAN